MSCKDIIFLRGYAHGEKFKNLKIAINIAEQLHYNQVRNTGEEYITHPARATCNLISLGIEDEIILSVCMLHDVIEDCNIDEFTLTNKYGLDERIGNLVRIVSKSKDTDIGQYFKEIKKYPECILVKLADRCHNISTMKNAFSKEKVHKYIEETKTYIIPLCQYGKTFYPEYNNQFHNMKNTLINIINSMEWIIELYSNEKTQS